MQDPVETEIDRRGRRGFLGASLAAGGLLMGMPAPSNAQERPDVSAAMEAAWQSYLATLEDLRVAIYNGPAKGLGAPAEAHYLFHQMQAIAFNLAIAPRQDYPTFYVHTAFEPLVYTWLLPCPDFYYRYAFLDGSRSYRIFGKRGSTLFQQILAMSGFWNDEQARLIGNFDLDQFSLNPDGSFELFLGGAKRPGNWIPLEPASRNNCLLLREAFYDWENEQGDQLHIETIDDQSPQPIVHDEVEFIRRMKGAERLMRFAIDQYTFPHIDKVYKKVGANRFLQDDQSANYNRGANPEAGYIVGVYQLQPDEALLIETSLPRKVRYWSIQLGDVYNQTTDYIHHQSSLNGHQARLDSDGKLRVVLSKHDPGVPNWLDPVDSLTGMANLRWYYADGVAIPQTRVVKTSEVRKHLPADTPVVTAEQRRAQLRARRVAALRRYHY